MLSFVEEFGLLKIKSKTLKKYKSPILLTQKGQLVAKEIADKIDLVLKQLDQLLTDSQREEFYQNLQNIYQALKNVQERKSVEDEH